MPNLFHQKIQLGETLSTKKQHLLINGKCSIHSALLNKNSLPSFKDFLLYFFYCAYIKLVLFKFDGDLLLPHKSNFLFVSPYQSGVQQATANVVTPQL